MTDLGRLKKVELREAWESEAGDFTPWLAQEENLKLLGDTIGLELELEGEEQGVGPFRADILCRDTVAERYVLIENQLERTDHNHLGQLMTYAAGLDAVVVVWVAARFTDEHRAALDWLNEVTDEDLSFFGLEVELWQIGESAIAPKFNIVSKPNEWSRSVSPVTGMTDTQRLRREYWSDLKSLMEAESSPVKLRQPRPTPWMEASIGRSHFYLNATMSTDHKFVRVRLVMTGADADAHFRSLVAQRDAIEAEIEPSLDWEELPEAQRSCISLRVDADPMDRDDWPQQHAWMHGNFDAFYAAFRERVKHLDASGNVPDEDDEGD